MARLIYKNPYVGPRPFEPEDRGRFFGRDQETSEVVSLIIAHRALLIYAGSGAGKSSLINAGIVPRLEEEGFEVVPSARVRGIIPESIHHQDIPNLFAFNTLLSWGGAGVDLRELTQVTLADFLGESERSIDEDEQPRPRVIIFDQFEELFTFYPERWQDREDFFRQLRSALEGDPLLRVVFVIREDFLAQMDPYTSFMPENLRTRFRLERLGGPAALSAIIGPTRDAARTYGAGVAQCLVDELLKVRVQGTTEETLEVVGQFVEPVQLQVVCEELWRALPPDVTVVEQSHLQTFGNVDRALSRFYENAILEASRRTGVKVDDLREWFERTLITPVGTRSTVFRGDEETGGIPNTAVDVLEDLHLIRAEVRAGSRWYELTHDRFIEPIKEANQQSGWTWVSPEDRAQRERRERHRRLITYGFIASLVVAGTLGALASWACDSLNRATELGNELAKRAENCFDIKVGKRTDQDGEYRISRGDLTFDVYCYNMAEEPQEYLTLDPSQNFSQYTAGGASPGENVRTVYEKVRLNVDNLAIIINEPKNKFAKSTGELRARGESLIDFMPYGVAADCVGKDSPTGIANIDLRGTPFAVDNQFFPQGHRPSGSAEFKHDDQVVIITGGGYCGANAPTILSDPWEKSNIAASDTEGIFLKRASKMNDNFNDNNLDGWQPIDQGANDAPSDWKIVNKRARQSSNIHGPEFNSIEKRRGTFIYWTDEEALKWEDYKFSVIIHSTADDGVGVLFRYQDENHYYKVELNRRREGQACADGKCPPNFRKLVKVEDGVETTLGSTPDGYNQGEDLKLVVTLRGDRIKVELDKIDLFGTVIDDSLSTGTVGLYSWANGGAFFDDVLVVSP